MIDYKTAVSMQDIIWRLLQDTFTVVNSHPGGGGGGGGAGAVICVAVNIAFIYFYVHFS